MRTRSILWSDFFFEGLSGKIIILKPMLGQNNNFGDILKS